jgi:hypothetical protein
MRTKTKRRRQLGPHLPKRKRLRLEALLQAAHRIAVSRKRSRVPIDVYSLPVEVIADRCGVSTATAKRWKLGRARIPHPATVVLSGRLGSISPHWHGWRIQGDALISPEGERIHQADLATAVRKAGEYGYSSIAQFANDPAGAGAKSYAGVQGRTSAPREP